MRPPMVDEQAKQQIASWYREYALHSVAAERTLRLSVRETNGREIGRVTLEKTPALPYLLSTDLWVDPAYRGTRVVDALDAMKGAAAQASNRIGIMASVHSDNIPELARLFKRGWRCVHYRKERHIFVLDV